MAELLSRLLACVCVLSALSCVALVSDILYTEATSGATSAYQLRGFIEIRGDSEFVTNDAVISGNGSYDNPFIISDWSINGSYDYGIRIRDTRAFFVLRNISVENSLFAAIKFENVSNARIENLLLASNLGSGINLLGVRNITISNCSIVNTGATGILGNTVENASLEDVSVSVAEKGLFFENSKAVIIRNCAVENTGIAFLAMSRCINSRIEDSIMKNSGSKGFELSFVNDTEFSGNAIVNASIGINLYCCNLLRFYGNAICVNRVSDLLATASSVSWNLTYAEGGGNYWSAYYGSDSYNGPLQDKPGPDGIIDRPFTIQPGNVDAYPLLMLVAPYVDVAPPVSNASIVGSPGPEGWYKSFAVVVIGATDDFSGVLNISYSIDSSPYTKYIGSFKISGSGQHVVRYRAVDRAFNEELEKTIIVKVDSSPPVTDIVVHGTKGQADWYLSSLIVSLNATDNESGVSSIWYSIDASVTLPYSSFIIVTSEGYHNLVAYSVDAVGNTGPIVVAQISIDRTPPELSINEANGSLFTTLPVTITWTASDSVSGLDRIEVSLDGGGLVRLPGTRREYSISGISDGPHILSVFAFDKAGHMTEGRISFVTDTGIAGLLMANMLDILALVILIVVILIAFIVRNRRRRRR